MYKQLIDKIRGRLSAPLHVGRGLGWLCLFVCMQAYADTDTSFPSIQGGARGGSPTTGALILRSPQDYQVYAISPNGEWACGVYVNMNNMGYGFRWNLLTDKVELLSGDLCLSEGSAISNDGVVAEAVNTLDLNVLPAGIYLVKVETAEGVKTVKVRL